jgi:hypothetical protein
MPEHVHLLVNEPKRALLSKAIQALKLSISMRGPGPGKALLAGALLRFQRLDA